MWTSSTPAGASSTAIRDLLLHVQRLDRELLAVDDLYGGGAARADQREAVEPALRTARPATDGDGNLLQHQLGALQRRPLGDQLERELERRRHDLAQVPDPHLDPADPPPARVPDGDVGDRAGDRQFVHQQILGSGSPTSWSITRRPPNAVSTSTMPGGSSRTSPISAARSQPSTARRAASAAAAPSGATNATNVPSLATYIGSIPSSSAAPATAGSTGTSPSRTTTPTPAARAISFSTEATPPRVASRRQWTCSLSTASTAGHSGRVSDSTSASSPRSPRASMIAVPCSPIVRETRTRSPGRTAPGDSDARGSRAPMPVVHTYMPAACPRSTTLVAPAALFTAAASAAAALAAAPGRGAP